MTDRTLTPEVYGDFGLFLDQMGFRKRPVEIKPKEYPKAETSDWYKQGKECPF
jgi:hypothetical protein